MFIMLLRMERHGISSEGIETDIEMLIASFTISLRYVIIFCCDSLTILLKMKGNYKWKRKRSFRCRIRTSSFLV